MEHEKNLIMVTWDFTEKSMCMPLNMLFKCHPLIKG